MGGRAPLEGIRVLDLSRLLVHDDAVVPGGGAGLVLVAPGVVVARAGGEQIDVPAARRQSGRYLARVLGRAPTLRDRYRPQYEETKRWRR